MVLHGLDDGPGAHVASLFLGGGFADLVGEHPLGQFPQGLRKIAGRFRQGGVLYARGVTVEGSRRVARTGLRLRRMTVVVVVRVIMLMVVVMVRMVDYGLIRALRGVWSGC